MTNRTTITDQLVDFVLQNRYQIFLDQFDNPSLIDPTKPFIAYDLNSKTTKGILSSHYWSQHNKALHRDVLSDTIHTLSSLASIQNNRFEVWNRIAQIEDTLYYDLGDNQSVIKIDHTGWTVANQAPVLFRRYSHQKIQVTPISDGDLNDLLPLLNIEEDYLKLLVLTYLATAFLPHVPRPLLIIHGAQGAGKTTCLEMIRSLIDPSHAPTLSPARSTKDMIIQAHHNYAYFLDNISRIDRHMSDTLCRFVTGSAFSKRALFTNDDEVIYSFKRLVAINGINAVANQPDLLDRSLLIQLERISESERQRRFEMVERFESIKPRLFGGLLNTVSSMLALAPTLNIERLPRMADYFHYATAASLALGQTQEAFSTAFDTNNQDQNDEAIEISPVAKAIIRFMSNRDEISYSSTRLYNILKEIAVADGTSRNFPQSSTWLWRKISEVKTNLQALGIETSQERDSRTGERKICLVNNRFVQPADNADTPSPTAFDLMAQNPQNFPGFSNPFDQPEEVTEHHATQ